MGVRRDRGDREKGPKEERGAQKLVNPPFPSGLIVLTPNRRRRQGRVSDKWQVEWNEKTGREEGGTLAAS